MAQWVRFCTSGDGVRLAYAVDGKGPPVVKAANWLTHLEHDWESPVWRHWLQLLTHRTTLVRYDERGCGLSDRDPPELSLDAWVADLEAVVEATGVEDFVLLGMSQGGLIAIAYAARHPRRVRRLVLYGTYARGRLRRDGPPEAREEAEALVALTRAGWWHPTPAYRRLFTSLFIPEGSEEQMGWIDELQRISTTPGYAAESRRVRYELDVTDLARAVKAPTLVLHARGDALAPFEEGRLLASLIPGADFISLESTNHILLADEPAFAVFSAAFDEFVGRHGFGAAAPAVALSAREHEVLERVAAGMSNEEIAADLVLSPRTVERHLSNVYAKLGMSGKGARAAAAAWFSRGRQDADR